VSDAQATRAVLRLINSPVLGNVDADGSPGYTLARIERDGLEKMLSSGEQRLVRFARSLWGGPTTPDSANVGELGGLDRTTRRKVLVVLWFYYLGEVDWAKLHADLEATDPSAWERQP
jgi:hypothetical protein